MWLKIWRDSSAMAGRPYYAEYDNEEEIQSVLHYYDKMIHGDGYHALKWEKIDKPPIVWLKKELHRYMEKLKELYPDYKQNRRDLQNTIANYKSHIKQYK